MGTTRLWAKNTIYYRRNITIVGGHVSNGRKKCKVCKSWTDGQCCAVIDVPRNELELERLKENQSMLNEVIEDNSALLKRLKDGAPEKALKFDNNKPDLTLLPRPAKEQIARVFMFGAKKYGRSNYKKGMEWTRLLAAAERHLTAFADGEDKDIESGENHLAHAGACIMMLIEFQARNLGTDDRK